MYRRSRGSALLLTLVVLVTAALACLALVHLGVAEVDRARAQTAADAAALAGAVGGRTQAQALAGANHSRLISYTETSDGVRVTVAVAGWTAEAQARTDPIADVGLHTVSTGDLP